MKKHITSVIELLESRIAPAGLITASLAKGTLTITGDGADNVLTLTQTATNLFTIASSTGNIELDLPGDDDPTPSASLVFSGLTGKIIANMGGGADTVTFTSLITDDSISVNMGPGTNTLNLTGSTIGSLTVTGQDGTDAITLSSLNVDGGISASLGDGANTVDVTLLNLGKDLTMTGGTGVDTFTSESSHLAGSLALNLGNGANAVTTETFLSIGKNLSITAGTGDDVVNIQELQAGGNVTISTGDGLNYNTIGGSIVSILGKLTINQGEHTGTALNLISGTYVNIRGATVVNNGSGDSETTVNANSLGSFGGITINGGDTADAVFVTGVNTKITGNLLFNGGNGDDYITVNIPSIDMKGAVTFLGGDGIDGATVSAGGKIGKMVIDLGASTGFETAGVLGATALKLGSLSIKTQTSDESYIILSGLDVKGSTSIVTGDANDSFAILGNTFRGNFSISSGSDNDTVAANDSYFGGSFTLKTGVGMDTVAIERNSTYSSTSEFIKTVTIDLGADDDNLSIGDAMAATQANFYGKVTYIGGAGTNTETTAFNNIYPTGQPKKTGF